MLPRSPAINVIWARGDQASLVTGSGEPCGMAN